MQLLAKEQPPNKNYRGYTKDSSTKDGKKIAQLVDMVQYYRDLWQKCSHILAPMTELTGVKKTKKIELNDS